MTPQEIEFWLKVASIAIPSLVALIVPFVTYRWVTRKMADYQTILSKEIEDYKKDISKELENHRFQLQSDFQTRFYEFQTKYSLLHQKKAEVIEHLFGLLAKYQNNLQILVNWKIANRPENKEDFLKKVDIDRQLLGDFFDEKRIFIDDDIKTQILEVGKKGLQVMSHQKDADDLQQMQSPQAEKMDELAKIVISEIHPVMKQLENKFKKLLSAENPKNQLEKKQ